MERLSAYESWIRQEGIPVTEAFGVEDLKDLPRAPWARTGGKGAFIQLKGMEGFTGMYVGEIPPGEPLKAQRHLYDEIIYVLQGRGATEVWNENESQGKAGFEWSEGGIFAVPMNAAYRLLNGSREPVVYLGVTSAPLLMDLIHDPDFIFGCDYVFRQRFEGNKDYFVPTSNRNEVNGFWVWESNFIADVKNAFLNPAERKGAGVRITALEMSGNALVGHIAEWPVGRYHKGHHHQGGAILLILRSKGYTLFWPQEAGLRPYQTGNAHQVVKVDWREGSVVSPPTGWFHQHFNTGGEPARQLAFRYTGHSGKYRLGIARALNKAGVRTSTRDGGTLIEYEDEDPQIRRDYVAALTREEIAFQMPLVAYG